jgi:hypothetical protein
MDAAAVSANRQNGVPGTSLLVCASFAVMVLAACKPGPPEGISAICNSNGENKYWVLVRGPCEGLPGGTTYTGCYEKVVTTPIFKCYGKDEWLAMDTGDTGDTGDAETGEAEETGGIDRAGWPTHEPSLTYIRNYCTGRCDDINAEKSGQTATCEADNWIIYGYDDIDKIRSKVLATALEDPGALNCDPDFGKWRRSPAESKVVQDDSVLWPSDSSTIDLACSTVQSCAELFDENVMGHLVHSSPTLPANDESEADYLVTAGISSSTLMLRIANPDNPSQGSNPVEGRIEYTALDCGQPTCPLYLGNLTITNTSDTWDLHSEALNADIDVTNLHARLRGPTLGVWRPATGEVYFDDQMLDLRVDFDVAVADEPASTVTKYVTNDGGLFGVRHGDHAIELANLSMRDEDLEAYARLDYDSADGSPPVARFTLSPTVVLGQFEPGLLVSSIPENSTDPDDDLDWKLWLIDGHQVAPGYVIPAGLHTIRLEVRDSRLAFDEREQLVMITHEEQK